MNRDALSHRQPVFGDGINLSPSLCIKLSLGIEALLNTSIYEDCNYFSFEQTAWRRGVIDRQSLLPALAVEVCPGTQDAESPASLLKR